MFVTFALAYEYYLEHEPHLLNESPSLFGMQKCQNKHCN